jgi:hypothetical protein
VGTPLERLRIPLGTWVRAAHAFSYQAPKGIRGRDREKKPTLSDIRFELRVAYRTVLRMRNVIKQAAGKYRGHKYVFQVRGYPYKRSHLVALRHRKISASDPPSTWWPGER